MKAEHEEFVKNMLKKAQSKDVEPQPQENNLTKEEIEETEKIVKKLKERLSRASRKSAFFNSWWLKSTKNSSII